MTVREFISLTGSDASLKRALDAEKPEGLEAFVGFARRHGCNVDPNELDETALSDVTGGSFAITVGFSKAETCRHAGCGGEILHVGDPFHSCECSRCRENHYWLWDFDYYTE